MMWYEEYGITKPYYADQWVCIVCADCRDILPLIPDKSIDLVLTDPPYLKEFIYLYEELAIASERLLKDEGLVIAYSGHYHLPEVLELMGRHLKFYWIFCLLHQGGASKMIFEKRISCFFKPIVAFSKDRRSEKTPIISDVIQGSGRAKSNHKWEQGSDELSPFLNKYTQKEDLILDPFLGSGTTAYCAKKLNRKCIGVEIEERYAHIAAQRCSQGVFNFGGIK